MFFHLSIPHIPFLYTLENKIIEGRYTENKEKYFRELLLVDQVLGKIIKYIKEEKIFNKTKIVVTSDLNVYSMLDKIEHTKVPFILKDINKSRNSIEDKKFTRNLIHNLFVFN